MNGRPRLVALLLWCLAACGGGGGGGASVGGASAPVFSSAASISVSEKTAGAFYTATASANGQPLAFTVTGGADAGRFAITGAGALSFVVAPDFEAPADADRDNVYAVTITATSGAAAAALALTITVTDVPGALAIRRVGVGFASPLFATGAGDNSGRVLIVQQGGLIRILDPATGAITATPFLDVSTEIATNGERGLLGLALAPDFASSRVFYVYLTNTTGAIEVRRYRTLAADPNRADPVSADIIFTLAHPLSNHNGGWMAFGADGLLYIGVGDGGGAGDPDGNGQNPNALLGKLLRIDPRTDAFASDPLRDYAIPAGNPFATSGGAPEIFSLGLRNPFRSGFDRQTGDLYIGDVGQGARKEIELIRAGTDVGRNFGWNILEGTATFAGGSTTGLTPPVAEYPHGTGALQGNSVTGGYVYRGPVTQFRGQYVFGDFVNRRIWTIPVASLVAGSTVQNTGFTDRTAAFTPDLGTIGNISSFGEDDFGNLFVVDYDGEIFTLREAD